MNNMYELIDNYIEEGIIKGSEILNNAELKEIIKNNDVTELEHFIAIKVIENCKIKTYICIFELPYEQIFINKVEATSEEKAIEKFKKYILNDNERCKLHMNDDNIICYKIDDIELIK